MAISLAKLQYLQERGVLPTKGAILDIGSSNLHFADAAALERFAQPFEKGLDADFANRLSGDSAHSNGMIKNESWVGELLEKLGMNYLALDIANGYRTEIFDLNGETLPRKLHGAFDTVLNFGTTEHLLNQLNAFSVIHDAVKVGGHIVHQLPASGFIDHGYFCYTPRFHFDLAGVNEYEVVDFLYDGPVAGRDIFAILKDYSGYFPVLKDRIPAEGRYVEDIAVTAIFRKTKDVPLRLPMERSTSVVREEPQPAKSSRTLLARLFER
jgi:SAM-dependent methyltransferase